MRRTMVSAVKTRPVRLPPWAAGANGGSASLQLIDNQQDNARVSNWSDGIGWKFFTFTNIDPNALQLAATYVYGATPKTSAAVRWWTSWPRWKAPSPLRCWR